MSRRECPVIGGDVVVVGWDPPLQTFFGQVYERGEDGPSVWVGAGDRLPTVEDLVDALGEWGGAVSGATRIALVEDKDANR